MNAGDLVMAQTFCGDVGTFHEGLAVVERGVEWFHVKEDGEPVYPQRYKMAEYFQNGLAWVQKEDGTWVKINRQGKEVYTKHTNASPTE